MISLKSISEIDKDWLKEHIYIEITITTSTVATLQLLQLFFSRVFFT